MSNDFMPIPDFIDVNADAVASAEAAVSQSSSGWVIPADVKVSDYVGKVKKMRHARWSESGTIKQAYRSVSKSGLMDVTLVVQSRTGMPNSGKSNFFHFYLSPQVLSGTASDEQLTKHKFMTEQSLGAIASLLKAVSMFPSSGGFKASLLNMLFPPKGQPGSKSPLDGKSIVVNVHATIEKRTVITTDEASGDSIAEEREETRVSADTFNPED